MIEILSMSLTAYIASLLLVTGRAQEKIRAHLSGIAFDLLLTSLYAVPVIVGVSVFHTDPKTLGLTWENSLPSSLMGVLVGATIVVIEYYFLGARTLLQEEMLSVLPRRTASSLVRRLLGALILFPLSEELLYRAGIQADLSVYLGWASVAASGLLFLTHHIVNPLTNEHFGTFRDKAFLIYESLAVGTVLIVTGSIIGCVIAHMLMNSIYSWTQIKRNLITDEDSQQVGGQIARPDSTRKLTRKLTPKLARGPFCSL
jgi:membrane protease YdiL (CAAX protease family)